MKSAIENIVDLGEYSNASKSIVSHGQVGRGVASDGIDCRRRKLKIVPSARPQGSAGDSNLSGQFCINPKTCLPVWLVSQGSVDDSIFQFSDDPQTFAWIPCATETEASASTPSVRTRVRFTSRKAVELKSIRFENKL